MRRASSGIYGQYRWQAMAQHTGGQKDKG